MNARRILTVFLVAFLFTAILSVSEATNTPNVIVDPSNSKFVKGDSFVVNITVDPAETEIFGAQYDLYFNPNVLQVTDQTGGNFLRQDGSNSHAVVNRFNNTAGKLEYGETRIGAQTGVNTNGTLAQITFNLTGCGSSNLTLSNVLLSNLSAQTIPNVNNRNGNVQGCIYGDLAPYPNGNCAINMGDFIRLLNHIHNQTTYPVDEDLADLDHNGEIETADYMHLAKHLTGIPGFEELK